MGSPNDIDTTGLVASILGLMIAALGWFLRDTIKETKETKKDLQQLKEVLPRDYVSKDDHERHIDQLMKRFDRFEEKLDKYMSDRGK